MKPNASASACQKYKPVGAFLHLPFLLADHSVLQDHHFLDLLGFLVWKKTTFHKHDGGAGGAHFTAQLQCEHLHVFQCVTKVYQKFYSLHEQ